MERQVKQKKGVLKEKKTPRRGEENSPFRITSGGVKPSQKSNEFYAGRLLKQIEKAFGDLGCFEMVDFSLESVSDLLTFLGYSGE